MEALCIVHNSRQRDSKGTSYVLHCKVYLVRNVVLSKFGLPFFSVNSYPFVFPPKYLDGIS